MFKRPFSFKGRIGRGEYAITVLLYFSLIIIMRMAVYGEMNVLLLLFHIPLYWFFWAQGAKRCHDVGSSGWYQIIPFYIFYMLFAEGDKHQNQYDLEPRATERDGELDSGI